MALDADPDEKINPIVLQRVIVIDGENALQMVIDIGSDSGKKFLKLTKDKGFKPLAVGVGLLVYEKERKVQNDGQRNT